MGIAVRTTMRALPPVRLAHTRRSAFAALLGRRLRLDPRTASQADIKKAFRKAAREHHPDRNKGDAEAERRFKAVNEANAVLSDPDKRALYDRLGKDWEAYSRAGATAGSAAGARAGGAGNPFGGFAGFGGPGGNVRYEFRTTGDAGEFSDFFQAFFSG